MSIGQTLYEFATRAAEPFLGLLVKGRVKAGKELAERQHERFARDIDADLPQPLVWMHGASIGETRLLLETASQLHNRRPDLSFLFTSQTRTAAELIADRIAKDAHLRGRSAHQFAPIDTPAIASRFLDTWTPKLCVFAEGEIWPNLLKQARARNIPAALINARMTEGSIEGWKRWPDLSREVFSTFSQILAGDEATATGLSSLSGKPVSTPGNLKASLPPPDVPQDELETLRRSFVGDRPCIAAVSTHPGEEAFVLDAVSGFSQPVACILVPRHPERGDEIAALLRDRNLSFSRRSKGEAPRTDHSVLLADTLGEVGLFASLADTVFLGGGHAPGIGGHNPLEILRLGKPVVTGPDLFNFRDIARMLDGETGFDTVSTPAQLRAGFPFAPPAPELLSKLEAHSQAPMEATLDALAPLLPPQVKA